MNELLYYFVLLLQVLQKIANTALLWALPILVSAGVAWVIYHTRRVRADLANKLDGRLLMLLDTGARWAVRAAEQYLKSGNGQERLNYAEMRLQEFLAERGITAVDVKQIRMTIEAALWDEINRHKHGIPASAGTE